MINRHSILFLLLATTYACGSGDGINGAPDADDIGLDSPIDSGLPDGDASVPPPDMVTDTSAPEFPSECTIERDNPAFMYEECHAIEGSGTDPRRLDIIAEDSLGEFTLEITSYPADGGPLSPGTYSFTEESYDVCSLCGLFRAGYGAMGMRLQIISGTLVITELEIVTGGRFVATLTDLIAAQVALLPSGDDRYRSEPVVDGEVLCIGTMNFDAEVSWY